MKRILIWRKPVQGSDIDIFHKTDYSQVFERTKNLYGYTTGINFGNRVWFQGICSAIDRPGNQITYGTEESIDEINANYDLIIYPMANFFSERYCRDTTDIAHLFMQLKIPMYIIACGAQADSYDYLDDLILAIGDDAKRFIEAVYHTGGEFALRGAFTKEFFNLLGFPGAVVTGCPSLFQLGPELRIEKKSSSVRHPLINGRIRSFEDILRDCPESVYLDQDSFLSCLYNPNFFSSSSLKKDILFYSHHSILQAELLGTGRIVLIPDVPSWYHYLLESNYDYSFGTKIHGSIMPLLAGIPATVLYIDSRTREMAEFFEIPCAEFRGKHRYTAEDIQASYQSADYSAFNAHFQLKFHAFEDFLISHGIVDKINTNNSFMMNQEDAGYELYQPNRERFKEYAKQLKKKEAVLRIGEYAVRIKNRIG